MIARMLTANGFAAAKISRAYQPGHDIAWSLSGRDLGVEVKARADGFRGLYSWLNERAILIVKADRQEPSSRDCRWRRRSSRLAAAQMWA